MASSVRRIDVFISSPGDVKMERDLARQVVQSLRRRYAGRLDLRPLLWENLPLQPEMSFQQGIDVVLSERGVEIAVFILWSRLGSPTGPLVVKDDGTSYRSGTEREYDLMSRAREDSKSKPGRPRPDILFYTRDDDASFEERFRNTTLEEKAGLTEQKALAEAFIHEQFTDPLTGTNRGAHFRYDVPVAFQKLLRTHLEELLDGLAGGGLETPIWDIETQGLPYLGLAAYDLRHAPIFLGREDEIVQVRQALRVRAQEGSAFVLISGASGSGKSSLARAGVLPSIMEYELDAVITGWEPLIIRPSELNPTPVLGLAAKLALALPALRKPETFPDFSLQLVKDPAFACRQFLRPALPAGRRLLLLVDQMEELFTRDGVTPEDRDAFALALEALARSGAVWIVATMRSDFSHLCQSVPSLIRLRDGRGQVDLLPPTADAIARVILDPPRLAGLRYEKNRDGVALNDLLLRDATEHRELLPFLSHILRVLVEKRTADGMLTFAAYQAQMGGPGKEANFRQALAAYAEGVFQDLPKPAQDTLDRLWPQLITLGGDDGKQPLRQYPPKESLTRDPQAAVLVNRFIEARLLTASSDRDDDHPTVTIVHETLFRTWDRAAGWIAQNQDKLQILANVERYQNLWVQSHKERLAKRDSSLLLPLGLPLRQARELRRKPGAVRIEHVTDYIKRSEQRAGRIRRRPLWLIPIGFVLWVGYVASLELAKQDIIAGEEASKKELSTPREPQPMPLTPKLGDRFLNGAGMEMIWCPPGSFVMGGTSYNDEVRHQVRLTHGFWMGRHEVTQQAWVAVMPDNPSNSRGDFKPVEQVDWPTCAAFCEKLTELERIASRIPADWQYDLPTEAQWEYACRAGTNTEFSFGDRLDGRQANVDGTQPFGTPLAGPYLKRTTVVGAYGANLWGFQDMHGNVCEWCWDAYQQDITGLTEDPLVEPKDAGSYRVFRGGLAFVQAEDARSAYRLRADPSFRIVTLGLRPVLVPSQTRPAENRR